MGTNLSKILNNKILCLFNKIVQNILVYRYNSVILPNIYLKNCNINAKSCPFIITPYLPYKMIAKWTHFNYYVSGSEPKRSLGQDYFVYTIKDRKINLKKTVCGIRFIFPNWDIIRKYFTGCSTSSYIFNMHPEKGFISRFHVMCIHDLLQNIEQKLDNYVCNFLQKPWTWNLPFIDVG